VGNPFKEGESLGEEISLSPISKEEIHKLEAALLVGTLFRPEVIQELHDPKERLTWVDSLAVATAALAREKAKMPVSRIADELGRSEATIRNHLAGKTKAGQLVRETFERFAREGVKIDVTPTVQTEELERLKSEVEGLKESLSRVENEKRQLEEKLRRIKEAITNILTTEIG